MSEEVDIFEKAFGKAPEKGYDFKRIEIEVLDNCRFKGLVFKWCASGVGFGEVTVSWGFSESVKNEWPLQYGFHCDTECMDEEFVRLLLIAAAPELAKLIMKSERKPQ